MFLIYILKDAERNYEQIWKKLFLINYYNKIIILSYDLLSNNSFLLIIFSITCYYTIKIYYYTKINIKYNKNNITYKNKYSFKIIIIYLSKEQ